MRKKHNLNTETFRELNADLQSKSKRSEKEQNVQCSDGRNQISIRFNRYLNRNEYSIQTLRDSIQVPSIWYWFDSNFNDSIPETRFKQKSRSHGNRWNWILIFFYTLLSQTLSSNVWFYHHWCMPAIIRSLLLSGEALNSEIKCT